MTVHSVLPETGYRTCSAPNCTVKKWHTAGVRSFTGSWYCSTECLPEPAKTSCAHCSKVIAASSAFIISRHTGRGTNVEHFCCERHANEFYLERLREGL